MPGDQELLGLGIVVVVQRGILLGHAVRARSRSCPRRRGVFGWMAKEMAGSGKLMPGSTTGLRLVAEGVAGEGLLELGHHPDLAGPERVDRLLRLALEPAPGGRCARGVSRAGVVDLAVGPQRARVDAEQRELADVRIGDAS